MMGLGSISSTHAKMEAASSAFKSRAGDVDGSFDSVKLGPGEHTKLQLLQNWLQAMTLCCRVVNFSVQ